MAEGPDGEPDAPEVPEPSEAAEPSEATDTPDSVEETAPDAESPDAAGQPENSEASEDTDAPEEAETHGDPEADEPSESVELPEPSEETDVETEETRLAVLESTLPAVVPKNEGKGGRKRPPRRRLRFWRTLFWTLFFLALAGVAVGIDVFDVESWQAFDPSKITNLKQTTRVYDMDGGFITALQGSENRTVVPLSEIPLHVRNAFLAAEDLRFYRHHGLDVVRFFGSVVANLKSQSYSQGFSTISQQLIKLTHLTSEKTLPRKAQEVFLAFQLERQFSKDEILSFYLNYIYFGNRAYGIQEAARQYFHKDVSELTVAEGAALAATIKAPSAYAPHLQPENNQVRREYVLRNMVENDMLDEATFQAALVEDLTVYTAELAPVPYGWFIDQVMVEAEAALGVGSEDLLGGGYFIYTTLSTHLQDGADALYANKNYFPSNASDGTPVQSAMAVCDVNTGALRAMVGGREYTTRRGLNRATQMRRQPGSAIKPLAVYAPAIQLGYTPASILLDEQGNFNGYSPRNAGNVYHGPTTLRNALALSMNVATVRLLQEIGITTSRNFMLKAGIPLDDRDANLSMALGALTTGVTPAELAASYALFANGGSYNAPYTIERILSPEGEEVYVHASEPRQVLSEQNAYLMTSLLQSVTSWGTGSKLQGAGVPVGGKTGTNSIGTGGNRDVWMAAFTADYSLTVWMGFDVTDNQHRLPGWLSGGDAPAALATDFLRKAYANRSKPNFAVPSGLVNLTIDTKAVTLRGQIMLASDLTPSKYRLNEVFLASNKPLQVSDVWQAPRAPGLYYIEHADNGMPRLVFTPVDSATLRVTRSDPSGQSIVLTELYGRAGHVQTFTDENAIRGVTYTYTLTPVHAELLNEGILLEGSSVAQTAQALSLTPGSIWEGFANLWN